MSLVANITPPAVGVLVCILAYVSVRRAHRKSREVAPLSARKAEPAE